MTDEIKGVDQPSPIDPVAHEPEVASRSTGPSQPDGEYKVGYKRPPKHSQFKPGVSGCPKGRRRKHPRVEIPSQLGKDIRNIARMKVKITTPEGTDNATVAEGVLWSIAKQAIAGKATQQKLFVTLLLQAYWENLQRSPEFANADKFNIETGLMDQYLEQWIKHLGTKSTKT